MLLKIIIIIDNDGKYYICDENNSNCREASSLEGLEIRNNIDASNIKSGNPLTSNGPCTKLKSPLKFLGYILLIVKIIIPLILIVFGIIDLFKAVTGGKDGEISKSLKSFMFRIIGGVAIFFVPTIISFIFTLVDGFDQVQSEYELCQKCILNVSQCD